MGCRPDSVFRAIPLSRDTHLERRHCARELLWPVVRPVPCTAVPIFVHARPHGLPSPEHPSLPFTTVALSELTMRSAMCLRCLVTSRRSCSHLHLLCRFAVASQKSRPHPPLRAHSSCSFLMLVGSSEPKNSLNSYLSAESNSDGRSGPWLGLDGPTCCGFLETSPGSPLEECLVAFEDCRRQWVTWPENGPQGHRTWPAFRDLKTSRLRRACAPGGTPFSLHVVRLLQLRPWCWISPRLQAAPRARLSRMNWSRRQGR